MNTTRALWAVLVLAVAAAMGVGCKNSKYCDNSTNPCPSLMTCDSTTHACVSKDGGTGGTGGTGGKTDGGGGDGGHAFRCDASSQCATRDGGGPICEIDGGSCVGCEIDGDCTDKTKPICGTDHTCRPRSAAQGNECSSHTGTTVCSGGECVECAVSVDCKTDATKPICGVDNKCRVCQADSECASKDATAPGVCMSHQDGRCATPAETIYVQNSTGCPAPSPARTGTKASPFCRLDDVQASFSAQSAVDLIVVVGPDPVPSASGIFQPPTSQTKLSLVGQAVGTIAGGAYPGLHISGSDVYLRGLTITASTGTGVVAESASTLRLDGVTISSNQKGGLQVTNSNYDIRNSLFAGNGSGTVNAATFGGVFLGTSPGTPARFDFNTVVQNQDRGVVCGAAGQTINASLLTGNMGGGSGVLPDVSTCTLSSSKTTVDGNPQLSATYRLTSSSPCKDFVTVAPTDPPVHDIDGIVRPQGSAYDCGASEFKP
jgi:hypothetical protein